MPDYNPSTIHFSLNESIWFEREQAVDELISIALNPHINIFDEQDFIVLKGALQLEGEYKHQRVEDVESVVANEQKYVQSVRSIEDEESQFTHRFPVDITIPKHKIHRVEDVLMNVESFDYEIENNQRLIIIANIEIDGIIEAEESSIIRNEKVEEEIPLTIEKRNESTIEEVNVEEEIFAEAEIEEVEIDVQESDIHSIPILREEDYIVKEVEEIEEEIELRDEEAPEIEEESQQEVEPEIRVEVVPEIVVTSEQEVELDIRVEESPEIVEEPQQEAVPELRVEEEPKIEVKLVQEVVPEPREEVQIEPIIELEEIIVEESTPTIQVQAAPERDFPSSSFIYPESSSFEEIEIESSSSEAVQVVKKKKGSTVTMSFAEFFSRKEEELARMKIYVVQEDDSLATIAERYNLSVQQLLRANHLDVTAEVNSGELLTIPVQTETKKLK